MDLLLQIQVPLIIWARQFVSSYDVEIINLNFLLPSIYTGSNNTAELCALGHAFQWITRLTDSTLMELSTSNDNNTQYELSNCYGIDIFYDSEYAAKSTMGIFNGKKNVELIKYVRKLLQLAENKLSNEMSSRKSKLNFVHVKGHSGNQWNDRADVLANMGSSGKSCYE
jgi:ribonuclease HI